MLETSELNKWLTWIWLHWPIALRAGAAVLAGPSGASHHLTAARPIVAGNPIATAIPGRAAALLGGDHERLLTTAPAFETVGCQRWTYALPFERADHNFYRAAQQGLSAHLTWPAERPDQIRTLPATHLVAELVPAARQGLRRAGVSAAEADCLRWFCRASAGGGVRS